MESTQKISKWFWPWQDDKEETWLGNMSTDGWHLHSVGLMGRYTFAKGVKQPYTYRLDYMLLDKKNRADYLQLFQDAGWEYIGEMSNWQYWRKRVTDGQNQEIFTDNESKIKKYQRLLLFMGFMLLLLVFLGRTMLSGLFVFDGISSVIEAIYFVGGLLYAIIIPLYAYVVIKLALRVRELRRQRL
jgi:hypothetical protein